MLPRNYQEICYNSRTNILTAVWNIKRNTNPLLSLPLRLLVWWVPSVISLIELSTIQDGGLLPCSSAFAPSVIDQNIPWNNTIMKKLGGNKTKKYLIFYFGDFFEDTHGDNKRIHSSKILQVDRYFTFRTWTVLRTWHREQPLTR